MRFSQGAPPAPVRWQHWGGLRQRHLIASCPYLRCDEPWRARVEGQWLGNTAPLLAPCHNCVLELNGAVALLVCHYPPDLAPEKLPAPLLPIPICRHACLTGIHSALPMGFDKMTEEAWEQGIDLNLKAHFNIIHKFLPQFVKQQSGCFIHYTTIARHGRVSMQQHCLSSVACDPSECIAAAYERSIRERMFFIFRFQM